jgi:iron-sulfur cluster insertion protein
MSQTPIIVTDAAAKKVWELVQEEGNNDLKLRVYVIGGGCSGFQYGFAFEEAIKEGDILIQKTVSADNDDSEGEGAPVQFIVDPMSIMYLTGAEIDYQEDLSGARFIIRNPNAETTCGCGSSFSV